MTLIHETSPTARNAQHVAAHRKINTMMEIRRFTSITAANPATASATGRNTNPPSLSNPHMHIEQNR